MNCACHRLEQLNKYHNFFCQRASFCTIFEKGPVGPQLKRRLWFFLTLLPIYLTVFVFFFSVLTHDLQGGFSQITIEETSGLLLLTDIRDILTYKCKVSEEQDLENK